MASSINWLKYLTLVCITIHAVCGSPKSVVYWGQDSIGDELPLRDYCLTYDIVVMGFVYLFPTAPGSDYPGINLANHCSDTFSGNPYLLYCPEVASDITYCQENGVKIMMSFGGAVGQYGFTSDAEAETFATLVWNMFLGGSSTMRPFGDVIVDGIDLDIEGGTITGYGSFVTTLRSYFEGASKTYYISAAPQCVYPDGYLGPDSARASGTAFSTSSFDFIWVQFYNNYCGLNAYSSEFNFNSWNEWATTISINPNVEVMIGAPASSAAAGSGYVDLSTLETIATAVSEEYSSFGGIMLWDAGTAVQNDNFGAGMATFIDTLAGSPAPPVAPPVAPVTTSKHASSSSSSSSTSTSSTSSSSSSSSSTSKKITSGAVVQASHTTAAAHVASSSTGESSSSGASGTCSTGYMTCASSETYQTCEGGIWGAAQSCQTGLTCTPSGNYIYCLPGGSTPISPPSDSSSANGTPTASSSGTTGTTGTTGASQSGSCANTGYMECATSETYRTCESGVWGTAQSCQVGLTCKPSGNYIYCE